MKTTLRTVGPIAVAVLVAVAGAKLAAADAAAAPAAPAAPPALDRAQVRAELAAHRAAGIARLHAYAEAQAFPHDFDVAPALHMFRDAGGRLCAVANLVHQDGRDDLVDGIAATRNDLAVADVHDGPLHDWMLASGFTQEELARIQKPAPLVRRPQPPSLDVASLPTAPMTEAEMNAAMVAHLGTVEAELSAATAPSLDAAVDRYLAAHAAPRRS